MNLEKSGLEGMPFKLLLVSLLIFLSMPIVMDSLTTYQTRIAEETILNEAMSIRSTAIEVFLAGVGNVRTLAVALPQDATIELGSVSNRYESFMIKCYLKDVHCATVVMDEPAVPIVCDGPSFTISHSCSELWFSCVEVNGQMEVKVGSS